MGNQTPTPVENTVSMDDLFDQQTARPQAGRWLTRLPHPEQRAILAHLDRLESGEVEDASEVLAEIRRLLITEGVFVSYTTTRLDDQGNITNQPYLGPDNKPVVAPGVFMLYLRKPQPGADLQGQIYKSFGRGRGWNAKFLNRVNAQYRQAVGVAAEGAGTEERIPGGEEEHLPG